MRQQLSHAQRGLGAHARARACARALLLIVACAVAGIEPAAAQTSVACSPSSYIYVAGFTGSFAAALNGYYAPYYNASFAPAALQACDNVNYGSGATAFVWNNAWNASWQSAGHPVGYYNTKGTVSDAANTFWVRPRGWRGEALRAARLTARDAGARLLQPIRCSRHAELLEPRDRLGRLPDGDWQLLHRHGSRGQGSVGRMCALFLQTRGARLAC